MFINLVMIVHRLVVTGKRREWRGVKMGRLWGLGGLIYYRTSANRRGDKISRANSGVGIEG